MTLNEKIDYLLNALKESDLIFLNGVACLFNEYETFENEYVGNRPESLCIDDVDGDDLYQVVYLTSLEDISLNNGIFKLSYQNGEKNTIQILKIKEDYSFNE